MYCMGAPIKVVCDDEGVVFSLEFVKRDAVVGLYCSPLDPIMNKERLKMEDAQLWGGGSLVVLGGTQIHGAHCVPSRNYH